MLQYLNKINLNLNYLKEAFVDFTRRILAVRCFKCNRLTERQLCNVLRVGALVKVPAMQRNAENWSGPLWHNAWKDQK